MGLNLGEGLSLSEPASMTGVDPKVAKANLAKDLAERMCEMHYEDRWMSLQSDLTIGVIEDAIKAFEKLHPTVQVHIEFHVLGLYAKFLPRPR